MNVTTYTPTVRKGTSIPFISSIFSALKSVFTSPKRLILFVVAIAAAFGLYTIFVKDRAATQASNLINLSQKFTVTAKTQDGKTTNGKFDVEVTGAYSAPSLLVQGQTVTARNGKDFLILNMEISNSYNLPLYMQPVDSFRLVGTDGKKYAPTAHQGNVEIRPQSTKTSNVGFVVPKDQKSFKVEVGELNTDKVVLDFSL